MLTVKVVAKLVEKADEELTIKPVAFTLPLTSNAPLDASGSVGPVDSH